MLRQHTAGLIGLSGGENGALAQLLRLHRHSEAEALLKSLQELFPDSLYVELPFLPESASPANEIERLARQRSLPLLAAPGVYYLRPEQAALQRTVSAIRLNCTLAELPPEAPAPPGSYFLSPAEMAARFQPWPAALANIEAVVDRCNLELQLDRPLFPTIETPPGLSALTCCAKGRSRALRAMAN